MTNHCTATPRHKISVYWVLIGILWGCSSSKPPPMAIRLHNPKTNQTLICESRAPRGEYSPQLAAIAEQCARDLESKGFVRDK